MQRFTYHCHTTFSDGKSTIEEMIKQAVEIGFTEIGITDHVEVHKKIFEATKDFLQMGWGDLYSEDFPSMLPRINKHINDIRHIAAQYPINVLVGFEVDFFTYNGWLEGFKDFRKKIDVDYLITGNHFVSDKTCDNIFPVTTLAEHIDRQPSFDEYIKSHFSNIVKAIESGMFAFAAHLDFVRWSGLVGEFDYKDERMEIIETLAKTGTPTEINTKGLASIGDFYPAQWMLKEMKNRKIPVALSDDAHHISQISKDFNKAEAMLEALDYKYRFDLKHLIKA